jgi:hypothetical protein
VIRRATVIVAHRATMIAALALAAAAIAAGAAAADVPSPPYPDARLQGSFELAGRVTAAHAVRGEHVGEVVDRLWSFDSQCPVGQCSTVLLVRHRAQASDSLVLHRRGPGRYTGSGSFFAPLRCAGRVYPQGEQIPFTIGVQIGLAVQFGTGTVATRLTATYVNRKRLNQTPCVAALGHDAARYHGHIAAPA